jgi:hypothetical protein
VSDKFPLRGFMAWKLSMALIGAQQIVAVREQRQIYLYDSELTNFACRISPKGMTCPASSDHA